MNERKVSEDVALVANVMSSKLIKIDANGSALQVAKKMSENKVSSVILTSNHDKIGGIITERDLVRKMCAKVHYQAKLHLFHFLPSYRLLSQ